MIKKQSATWQLILESLQKNIPVALLYVLESKGSSPGRQGFFMAVNHEGEMQGSIGGGMMEHKLVELAKQMLHETHNAGPQVKKQIHDKTAQKNQSGMICSGEQTVFIYPVQEMDIDVIKEILQTLTQNKNAELNLSTKGISISPNIPDVNFSFQYQSEENWMYKEKIGYKNHLYIIGGGHCALAFSRLMSQLDFQIHLFEEREGLNTFQQNQFAFKKSIVKDYSELKHLIPPGKNSYVVIMTFGYRTDDIALRAILDKDFKYLGLLGSKKKIEKMFADYRVEGIEEVLLQKIHAPVGIDIKSETPEEIAISIAAEIIKIKNAVGNKG